MSNYFELELKTKIFLQFGTALNIRATYLILILIILSFFLGKSNKTNNIILRELGSSIKTTLEVENR